MLTLHPDKSRIMIHSRDKPINIILDGKTLTMCGYGLQDESVKLLGINIDENLDWKVHRLIIFYGDMEKTEYHNKESNI